VANQGPAAINIRAANYISFKCSYLFMYCEVSACLLYLLLCNFTTKIYHLLGIHLLVLSSFFSDIQKNPNILFILFLSDFTTNLFQSA